MEKEALKRIFEFLEDNEEHNAPFRWKILNNIPLTKEDLNVKGNLDLYEYKSLTSLPKGLKVGSNLDVSHTPKLKSLPSDLDVKGNIYMGGTKITSLPEGLKVGGTMYVYEAELSSLPKGLEVGGDLYLREVDLKNYSDDELREMIKPGFIKGEIVRD